MKIVIILVLSFFAFAISSCSGQSEDISNVRATVIDEVPRVFDIPITYTVGEGDNAAEVDVEPPWYRSQLSVINGTDKTLTINNIVHKVSAFTETGEIIETVVEFGPEMLPENNDDNEENDKTYIFELKAGAVSDPDLVVYYTGGLTDKETGKAVSYNYSVELELQGWFGKKDNPQRAFKKQIFFNTTE